MSRITVTSTASWIVNQNDCQSMPHLSAAPVYPIEKTEIGLRSWAPFPDFLPADQGVARPRSEASTLFAKFKTIDGDHARSKLRSPGDWRWDRRSVRGHASGPGLSRASPDPARKRGGCRPPPKRTQQWSDPLRNLLQARFAESPAVRRRGGSNGGLLSRAWHSLPHLRRGHRRHQ